MEIIRKRRNLLAVFTWVSFALCAVILLPTAIKSDAYTWIFLGLGILVSGFLLALWVREIQILKIATLISENEILNISPAIISDEMDGKTGCATPKGIKVLISYFGILLDAKIIKFNQDGIRLKGVEIHRNYISITYGTEQWIQNIRLMSSIYDEEEIKKISKKFEYETGIKPIIVK